MITLSQRLQLVYDQLLPNQDVWDFCCDHGYLGAAAYESQQFKNIYFVDPVASIMTKLEKQFSQYVYKEDSTSTAHFILKNGQDVNINVSGNVSIIGVGGLLIYEILEALALKNYLKAQRIILGPHRDEEKLLALIEKNQHLHLYKLGFKKEVLENNRTRNFLIYDLK